MLIIDDSAQAQAVLSIIFSFAATLATATYAIEWHKSHPLFTLMLIASGMCAYTCIVYFIIAFVNPRINIAWLRPVTGIAWPLFVMSMVFWLKRLVIAHEVELTAVRQLNGDEVFAVLLAERFDLEELAALAAEMGINIENVKGETLSAKCRYLVLACKRRGAMGRLRAAVRVARPGMEWG